MELIRLIVSLLFIIRIQRCQSCSKPKKLIEKTNERVEFDSQTTNNVKFVSGLPKATESYTSGPDQSETSK